MIDNLYYGEVWKLFCGLQNELRKALLFITKDLNGPNVPTAAYYYYGTGWQYRLTVVACTSGNLVIQVQHRFSFKKNRMMQHRTQKLTTKF